MIQPYLPPAEPSDNPAPPEQPKARNTLLVWLVLIVACLVVYTFLNESGPPRRDVAWDGCAPCSRWPGLISWLPIGLGVSFFAFMWWQLRRGTRFALLLEPGILALAERRFDRAAEEFRSVMRAYKRQSQYVAVARINLAHALFRQGDLRGATAEAIGVEQTIGLIWSSDVRTHATLLLARLYAVQGETAAAERWIAEGRKRLARSGSRLVIAASLRIAEAIVCCRQGRFGEAAEMLDQDMRRIEAALAVSDLAVVWLLRAFAAAQLTSPRDAGAVTPFIAVLRTQPPGTFDHLAGQWPELAMFLAENGLAAVESV